MGRRVKLSVHVTAEVAETIQRLAAHRKESVSAVASELLEKAALSDAELAGESLLMPLLEELIEARFQRGFDRLARLLVRNGLEAGTTRRLITHWMKASYENDAVVEGLSDQFWKKSVESLKAPLKELPELVRVSEGEGLNP